VLHALEVGIRVTISGLIVWLVTFRWNQGFIVGISQLLVSVRSHIVWQTGDSVVMPQRIEQGNNKFKSWIRVNIPTSKHDQGATVWSHLFTISFYGLQESPAIAICYLARSSTLPLFGFRYISSNVTVLPTFQHYS